MLLLVVAAVRSERCTGIRAGAATLLPRASTRLVLGTLTGDVRHGAIRFFGSDGAQEPHVF